MLRASAVSFEAARRIARRDRLWQCARMIFVLMHATGALDVQLPPFASAAGATVTGRSARIDLALPPEARLAGALYESKQLAAAL